MRSAGSVRRCCGLGQRSTFGQALTVQDGAGSGIHAAVVRAAGWAVVFEYRAHFGEKYDVVYTVGPSARISDDRV